MLCFDRQKGFHRNVPFFWVGSLFLLAIKKKQSYDASRPTVKCKFIIPFAAAGLQSRVKNGTFGVEALCPASR